MLISKQIIKFIMLG